MVVVVIVEVEVGRTVVGGWLVSCTVVVVGSNVVEYHVESLDDWLSVVGTVVSPWDKLDCLLAALKIS